MILGIINHFISMVIMRKLLVIFSILFSTLSFANLDDGIYAHLQTNKGKITVELAFKKAPLTVTNFIALAEGTKQSIKELGTPYYDGIIFHRVIDEFMIQGGYPKGNGTGGPGYMFADEFSDLIHDKPGVLSMANSGPNTNGSQFFITHVPTPSLDGKHILKSRLGRGRYLWIMLTNLIATILSLGLLRAWAAVRTWRYLADHTALEIEGDLDSIVDTAQAEGNVAAAEYFDIEGIDFGL